MKYVKTTAQILVALPRDMALAEAARYRRGDQLPVGQTVGTVLAARVQLTQAVGHLTVWLEVSEPMKEAA